MSHYPSLEIQESAVVLLETSWLRFLKTTEERHEEKSQSGRRRCIIHDTQIIITSNSHHKIREKETQCLLRIFYLCYSGLLLLELTESENPSPRLIVELLLEGVEQLHLLAKAGHKSRC